MRDSLNATIAARFDEVAMLLEEQDANPYRVAAYRRAADILRDLSTSVTDMLDEGGIDALQKLPGIGESLSRSIQTLAVTGYLPLLYRLRGENAPLKVLTTIPGIGPKLAERLNEQFGIDSLDALEEAAFDGRLKNLAGFGDKRLAGIRDVLARRLGRVQVFPDFAHAVPVEELLDVDREYREKAEAGELHQIAPPPRRSTRKAKAGLPVLHTRRGTREYTALFSNTERAHEAGMTREWVVIYCDDGSREHTSTVITAKGGPLRGLRIIAGREDECAEYYERTQQVEV